MHTVVAVTYSQVFNNNHQGLVFSRSHKLEQSLRLPGAVYLTPRERVSVTAPLYSAVTSLVLVARHAELEKHNLGAVQTGRRIQSTLLTPACELTRGSEAAILQMTLR